MGDTKLWEALDLLRRDGWRKGSAGGRGIPACVLGAAVNVDATIEDHFALDKVAAEQYPDRAANNDTCDGLRPAAAVNDHPDTTFADVERILTKAAIRREEEA